MWHKLLLTIVIILNILLLGRLFFSEQGLTGYNVLKAETTDLALELEKINEKNLALSREIELLNSDEKYIEKIIRNKLNFVKNNEILYLFQENQSPSTSGAAPDDGKN